jgi:hypothetical protein
MLTLQIDQLIDLHDLGGLQLVVVVSVGVVVVAAAVVVVENNENFLPRQAVQFEVVVVVEERAEGPEEQYQEAPRAWQQLPRL